MQDITVGCFYDCILDKTVYGVVPEDKELKQIMMIAEIYKNLSQGSKEYIRTRIGMIGEDR